MNGLIFKVFIILIYGFLDYEIKRMFWESNKVRSQAPLVKVFFYQFLIFLSYIYLKVRLGLKEHYTHHFSNSHVLRRHNIVFIFFF